MHYELYGIRSAKREQEVEPWLNTQMANRKIAYTLGRGRAYIFDQKPAKPATDSFCSGTKMILGETPNMMLVACNL